jgi:hypothetical protein
VRAARIPDNVTLLQELVAKGVIIPTPPQDYDDSYCITYAKQRDAFIVTNDLFRDHLQQMPTSSAALVAARNDERAW